MTDQFEQEAYWSAVSQLAPLVGLALVLETRRFVASWNDPPRAMRISFGLAVALLAYFLVQTEVWSLSALLRREEDEVRAVLATNLIVATLTAIGVNTIVSIAMRTNTDSMQALKMRLPWSPLQQLSRANYSLHVTLDKSSTHLLDFRVRYKVMRRRAKRQIVHLVDVKNNLLAFGPIAVGGSESQFAALLQEVDSNITDAMNGLMEIKKAQKDVQKGIRRLAVDVARADELRAQIDDGSMTREAIAEERKKIKAYIAKMSS